MADGGGRSPVAQSLGWALAASACAAALSSGAEATLLARSSAASASQPDLFIAAAAAYMATGIVAWQRRPSNRTGVLMVAAGLSWLAAALAYTSGSVLVTAGDVLAAVPLAIVVHLLVAFPSGRLRSAADRWLVAVAYFAAVVLQVFRVLSERRASEPGGPLVIGARPDLAEAGTLAQDAIGALVMILTAVLLTGRLTGATRRGRRARLPVYAYGVAAMLFIPFEAAGLARLTQLSAAMLADLQPAVLAGVPVAFIAGVLFGGFPQMSQTQELDSWLRAGLDRPPLDRVLTRVLGDDSVQFACWLPELSGYADERGRPTDPPSTGSGRAVAEIRLDGRLIGAVAYDATLIADSGLVSSVGEAAVTAVERQRLTAELLASRETLRESRKRIVEAADLERQRIARDLHDSLQSTLVLLGIEAQHLADQPDCPAPVAEAAAGLRSRIDSAAEDLRRIVHEVMPAALIEGGLADAVRDLADRLPIPVHLELAADDAVQGTVASTAYFVLGEAVTNALRHAHPSALTIRLLTEDDNITVEVADDGSGGAVMRADHGLRGMADRVEALGGSLVIESPAGQGTRLTARLPRAADSRGVLPCE